MMLYRLLFLLSFTILYSAASTDAQECLLEGTITYNVVVERKGDQKIEGLYVVTLKSGQVKKALILPNGFNDITLINYPEASAYSLRGDGKQGYAIQLDYKSIYSSAKDSSALRLVKTSGDIKKIAGVNARGGKVIFKDGNIVNIYYSDECLIEAGLFEQFPGLEVLPLKFTLLDKAGILLHFEAKEISTKPVESAAFKIPESYKIISWEEYLKMNH